MKMMILPPPLSNDHSTKRILVSWWVIWKARNDFVFRNLKINPSSILMAINSYIGNLPNNYTSPIKSSDIHPVSIHKVISLTSKAIVLVDATF